MSESVFVGQKVSGFTTAPVSDKYTGVRLYYDGENYYQAGTDENVLEIDCPWGTEQMARDILASVKDFVYVPYETEWALLDPAAELGDGVTISGVYSGIYSNETSFSALMDATISAPQENEVDSEYTYQSKSERKAERQYAEIKATLQVNADSITAEVLNRKTSEDAIYSALSLQADEIAACVTQEGGTDSSFSWKLTSSGFYLYAKGSEVFAATETGVSIKGRITAESGFIGDGENGFTITDNALYNGLTSLSGTDDGVYIGTDGISLGGGKFKVDSSGNLSATSGTFTGSVYANKIQVGDDAGYITGSQIGTNTITGGGGSGGYASSNIASSTISTADTSSYINAGLANAYDYANFSSGSARIGYCKANYVVAGTFSFDHYYAMWTDIVINGVTYTLMQRGSYNSL